MGQFVYPYDMAGHLIVTGEDAADFLQSQFSNDLRPFSKGQCTYGLWLDVKGKILADSWVLCEGEEEFRIYSECCEGQLIKDKLEHHIIADDVELELGPPTPALALIGEGCNELVEETSGVVTFCGRRSILPSRELVFADEASRRAWLDLQDCESVSKKWIQAKRMEAGASVVQCEALPGDLPAEGGLVQDAVSFTKGCFLGQEVVARMHNIGRPQRVLFVLSGSEAPSDVPSALVNGEGKALGELRTCVATAEGWKGVALLKSRFVESGTELLVGGKAARVDNPYERI